MDLARQTGQEPNLNIENGPHDFMLEFEFPQLQPAPQPAEGGQVEVDIKPKITPKPIDPLIEIEVSDSEDYSSSENEWSDFELDDVIPEAPCTSSSLRPFAAHENVPPVLNRVIEECSDSANVDSTTAGPLRGDVVAGTLGAVTANTNTGADSLLTGEPILDAVIEVVKSETVKPDPEDDTLKFLQELDHSKEDFTIKTSIFDDEPIVFLEISSSGESDSESEDACDDNVEADTVKVPDFSDTMKTTL